MNNNNNKALAMLIIAVIAISGLALYFDNQDSPDPAKSENEVTVTEEIKAAMRYAPPETTPIGTDSFVISFSPGNDPNDLNNELEKLKNKGYKIKTTIPWTYWRKLREMQLKEVLVITDQPQ